MAQTTNTHNEALAKLCRVCGQLLSAAGRSTYCTKSSQSLLKSVFGIESEHDDPQVHPQRYCHHCRGVTYHTGKKEGGLYKHHTEVFRWSPHTDEGCQICGHVKQLAKGGRKKKTSKRHIGRPPAEASAMRVLFKHTQRVAPPQLCQKPVEYAREQSLPLTQLTCPICTDVVDRPVELTSCSSIVCCECLCQWLSTTENTKCPCCYEDHLQDCDTIKQPTQFFLSILGQVEIVCKTCREKVKMENHANHCCGSHDQPGTSMSSSGVEAILSRDLNTPLTPVEEQLQSSLARRSLSQSTQPLLRIKTGGQVGIIYTPYNTYGLIQHTCTTICSP